MHPGASYSTADVFSGLVGALRDAGVELMTYDLESRLEMAGRWMSLVWNRAGRPQPKYSGADVVYGASKDAVERALRWNADGVLVISGMFLHPDILVLLRRAGIRTAVVLTESPYDDDRQIKILPLVDVAWTNERSSVARLRHANPNVHYLPHAYNPDQHRPGPVPDDVPTHDVVFVGSLFAERAELLGQVDWAGIDLALYGDWRGLPSRSRLRGYVRGSVVDNRYAALLYRNGKIGLNLYRESIGWGRGAPRISHAESLNPRALELAACGTFQLSHYRAEVAEVFGAAVPTFTTPDELGRLVRYYLQSPAERHDKAARSLQALGGHTFADRAATILADLADAGWPVPSKEPESWHDTTEERGGCTLPRPAPASLSLSPA